MPSPTREMIVATSFNRNHAQNMEGGIIEEEFRQNMLTIAPIHWEKRSSGYRWVRPLSRSQIRSPHPEKLLTSFFQLLQQCKEAGQISWDDALPTPTLMLPNGSSRRRSSNSWTAASRTKEKKDNKGKRQGDYGSFNTWLQLSRRFENFPKEKYHEAFVLSAYYQFDRCFAEEQHQSKTSMSEMRAAGWSRTACLREGNGGKALTMNGEHLA